MKPIIDIIYKDLIIQQERDVMKAIQMYDIDVDKDRLVQALRDARAFYEEGYADGKADAQQKWIPVTERLPEKNTAVIAAEEYGIVFQCRHTHDGWDLWLGHNVNITHWMPLPEAPKEGE